MLMQVAFRSARPALAMIVWVWTAVLAVGCAGRSLDELPSKNVDLTGDWKLNASLSDDVPKLLQSHFKTMSERMDRMPSEMGPIRRPSEGMTRRTGDDVVTDAEPDPGGIRKLRKQREERFTAMVEAPQRMEISLNGTRFIVKHDETRDEFRAGERSVVSFGRGVADRTAGWSGRQFIVSTRGLDGGSKEERYSLDPEGRLLLVTKVTGDRMPTLEIKRIYERSRS
jgi:hypothetical protein